jgi:dTDP-4-dehydrorhamnose reductase
VKLVVTGAAGMLGQDVMRVAGGDAVGFARTELDVTDAAAVWAAIEPDDVVINCAAWTDVDGAEEHADEAMRVNRDGACHVAEAAGRVVHVSTDYVFDGRAREPYVETDATNPIQQYGRTKLAGELAVAQANENHLIVRSSWLFGAGGKNFVETMLAFGAERDELRVVDDQVGCPTFTGHLAEGLVELAQGDQTGIRHLAGGGSCSWYEFAREIVERAGVDSRVNPCTSDEYPRPARRPAWSVLGSVHADGLPRWQDGLDAYLGVRA